jgi:hypothetical protein
VPGVPKPEADDERSDDCAQVKISSAFHGRPPFQFDGFRPERLRKPFAIPAA